MFSACTKDIVVDVPDPEPAIVVEGSIEPGRPPIVMLTKNSAFFGGIDVNDIASYFINDAIITVWTNTDTVTLNEWCTDALPDSLKRQVAAEMGFNFNNDPQNIGTSPIPNICVYTVSDIFSLTPQFVGQEKKTYHLRIETGGKTLTSSTYIPGIAPLTLSWRPHPNQIDSLATVVATVVDPDTAGNRVRYLTQRQGEPMYRPISGSVYDDAIFVSGSQYDLPLERGQDPQVDIDLDTYSYFWRGDTVRIKWSTIDRATYEFWYSLESDAGSSPFSSPVKIKTNITGGLGIWAGYGTYNAEIIIPQ